MAEIQAIIDGKGGSLTKWNKLFKRLMQSNIPYRIRLAIWDILVHPENRGGLGLNAFNVHQTMATVKSIGADPAAVHMATCFEMAPDGAERKAQVAFNQNLIGGANGLLAPLSGRERVCSVACSHFTAGCRASEHSCHTPEGSLKDVNGRINLIQLCEDDLDLKDLITRGWDWWVLPYICQKIWPKLPDLAQDALNAEHATFSMASELQVMVSAANRASLDNQHGMEPEWKKINDEVTASQPPCVAYLDVIVQFVKLYAGGAGAPGCASSEPSGGDASSRCSPRTRRCVTSTYLTRC